MLEIQQNQGYRMQSKNGECNGFALAIFSFNLSHICLNCFWYFLTSVYPKMRQTFA